jgi:DNA-directed RNA polymerase delta subunit
MTDAKLSLELLSDATRSLSIGHLHLSIRAYNVLVGSGITTIGNLVESATSGFDTVSGLGKSSMEKIIQSLVTLSGAIDAEGSIDWLNYWKSMNIQVLPRDYEPGLNHEQIFRKMSSIIQNILCYNTDDRSWFIVERRFGLNGKDILTLEALGEAFGGLTRERIRQIENKALLEIRNALIDSQYSGMEYHVHPEIIATVKLLINTLVTEIKDLTLETELLAFVHQALNIDPSKNQEVLFLLFYVAGLRQIKFDNPDLIPVWKLAETDHQETLEKVIKHLDNFLTKETSLPRDEIDILMSINKSLPKSKKLTQPQLRRFIELCSSIEKSENGLFRGKFEHIKMRAHQVERILSEANKPMSVSEIAQEMNRRLVPLGQRRVAIRTLGNQISDDGRFVPLGGKWGLKSWKLDTGNILDFMRSCLDELGKPATADEIYNYVNNKRSVSKNSIVLYLTTKQDLFRAMGYKKWGLADWPNTPDTNTWSPEEVADFVADIFKKHRKKELEFKIVKLALMKEAGVNDRQARGMLNCNPVIKTRRLSYNKTYAIFQPDYKNVLQEVGARFKTKKPTLRQKFDTVVKELLDIAPEKQMELADIVAILNQKHGFREKTIYRYITEASYLEKNDIPERRTKICRLKNANISSFPQIEQMSEDYVAAEARRAVSKLTVDEVDIGLFLLGKLFEGTLKDYVLAVEQAELYNVTPPPDKKLNNLVSWIKKEGIVVDATILHVLREERNERAHGKVPSLEERRRMLGDAVWIAERYLDHILLFVEKKQKLLNDN